MASEQYTVEQLDEVYSLGIRAASLRNPIQDWLADWSSGGESNDAGVAVTYNSSLSYVSVFAAVSLISRDIAKVPCNVHRIESNGDKITEFTHPAHWMMNSDANQYMSALVFRMLLQSHVLLWGNAYAEIIRDGSSRPMQLIPLMPDRTTPKMTDGRLIYETRRDNGEMDPLQPENVFHLKGLSWDGLQGHSVISLARRQWGLGIAQEKHGARGFKNDARPSFTLTTDSRLDPGEAEYLLEQWKKKQGGDNQRSPALLTGGVKVQPFSMSNEDAQWLESRDFNRTDVAHWFSLPPHKISKSTELPYNSLIAAEQAYLNDTLSFWYRQWEDECERKLFAERLRRSRSHCMCHDVQALMNADIGTRVEVQTKLKSSEVLSTNEIRRSLGMPGIGPEGDEYRNPNTRARDQAATEPEADTSETEAAVRNSIAYTMGALIASESSRVKNAAKTAKDFVSWCDNFYSSYAGRIGDAMQPLIATYTTLPGVRCEFTSTEIGEAYADRSKDELLAAAGVAMDREELLVHVTETVKDWPARADQISRQICEVSYVPNDE